MDNCTVRVITDEQHDFINSNTGQQLVDQLIDSQLYCESLNAQNKHLEWVAVNSYPTLMVKNFKSTQYRLTLQNRIKLY